MRGSIISISRIRTVEAPMADFLIRDLNADVMDRLRTRALANGRSMQAEVHEILTRSVKRTREETIARARELREKYAGCDFLDAAELIREDRDTR